MTLRTATRWAIVGDCGLYDGQSLTRGDAIARHVYGLDRTLYDAGEQWCRGELSEAQKTAWAKRKRIGDRAVKVQIAWKEESNAG